MTIQIFSIAAAAGILAALLGWRIWRIFRPRASWLDHPAVFFFLVFATMLALRLPGIEWAHEFDVDESQLLAQGARYLSHPVPWRDVDGTTSGPLDSWFLSAPIGLGAPANWATSRTMLWGAQCATLIFIYLALRCFGTRPEAQLALMPTVFFYGFVLNGNFNYYSSETVPVLLLSLVVWRLCRAWMTEKFSNADIFFTGFLAGCLPFTKLQVTPLAAFLVATGLGQIFFGRRKNCGKKSAVMLAGAAVFPALLLGVVVACGAGNDFWKSYVLEPRVYAGVGLGEKIKASWTIFTQTGDFKSYLASALAGGALLAVAWCYAQEHNPGNKLAWALAAILAMGAVTVFCVMEAGKTYGHYLLLLIPAQAIFFGLVLVIGARVLLPEGNDPHLFPKPVHWFLAGFAIITCLQIAKPPAYFGAMRDFLTHRRPDRKSFVARRIMKASRPGDTLSVWGWMPSYYVESGLIPATRDAIGHFVIEEGPYQAYFRQRYLHDLEQSKPAVFVDAMAWGVFTWSWPTLTPHESFPALSQYIEANYSPWLTIHILTARGAGVPVRIYVLKQRMEELDLVPEELDIPKDPLLAPE